MVFNVRCNWYHVKDSCRSDAANRVAGNIPYIPPSAYIAVKACWRYHDYYADADADADAFAPATTAPPPAGRRAATYTTSCSASACGKD
eukprot:6214028-Pleurochrysis_carterae.AAC.4